MKKAITNFLKYGTLLSTYGLMLSVMVQIFARFFLPSAPAWTEEASRLFFIYAIAFSAGLALESKDYIHLDWLFNKLPKTTQKYLLLIISLLILGLFATIALYAIQFSLLGHQETAAGMRIRMSYAFFSIVIMASALSYFAGLELVEQIKNWKL